MQKIVIKIEKDTLIFKYRIQSDDVKDDLINTNIISNNNLSFSSDYILDNGKIVGLFIKELVNEKKIDKIVINKFDMFKILELPLKIIEGIDSLYISDENNFTYEAYEIITRLNKFKKINCYSIPTYMLDLFDKQKVMVECRAEILFTSNFMEDNSLTSYSKIYYKTSIKLSPPLYSQDVDDFITFCKVNKYLKVIHFDVVNIDALDSITNILINNRIKKIRICIHDNITSKDIIEKLKKKKKQLARKGIYLELRYTEEYIKVNFAKQLILTTLTVCAIIALLILGGAFMYVIINNHQSEINVAKINEQIEEKITQDNLKKEQLDIDDIENNTKENNNKNNNKILDPNKTSIIEKMNSVKELNSDAVGWITIPETKIDYPVVQTNNNEYYLNHNFNKEKDYNGWVFMNYFNVPDNLDKNTILFAHNRYYSGVMFGTLNKVTKKKWYEKYKENLISFSTLYEEMNWEVFSIYTIDVNNDYLKTIFNNEEEWFSFITLIRDRSIFKSDVNIDADDKILTLSTCLDNDQRLVVHAVLKRS